MNKPPLDYEIIESEDGEWQVWTPDKTGGVLGTGKTRESAIANGHRESYFHSQRTNMNTYAEFLERKI